MTPRLDARQEQIYLRSMGSFISTCKDFVVNATEGCSLASVVGAFHASVASTTDASTSSSTCSGDARTSGETPSDYADETIEASIALSSVKSPSFSTLMEFDCLLEILINVSSYLSWQEMLQARLSNKRLLNSPRLTSISNDTHGLALVRVDCIAPASSISAIDLTPEARERTTIYPLHALGVLGRNHASPTHPSNGKIDLGIGREADGVSRRQARIAAVTVKGYLTGSSNSRERGCCPSVTVSLLNTFVGVAHYGSLADGINLSFKYAFYRKGSDFVLRVGDCLVFDAYNGNARGGPRNDDVSPNQVFRLVRYDRRLCASQADDEAALVVCEGNSRHWIVNTFAAGLLGSPFTVS